MVTAVVSDLHLGTRSEADLLRRGQARDRLFSELDDVDHLVLLGDTIELRDGPLGDALQAAAPFFEQLDEVMGGRRVTLVPGNHDYQLAAPWLERRRRAGGRERLGLEQLSTPKHGDPLSSLSQRMGNVELVLAYPGLWLRPDVYATHGHYLDCHNQVLTFECLARMVTERLLRARRRGYRSPDDYEAALRPLYRLLFRIAQPRWAERVRSASKAIVREWERIHGYRGPLRRPGLGAMAQVVERLPIEAEYVLFGHLHRPGPFDGEAERWRTTTGTTLVNAGSWVYEPAYLGPVPAESPHRPGTCVIVRDTGPPELKQVLTGLSHRELRSGS